MTERAHADVIGLSDAGLAGIRAGSSHSVPVRLPACSSDVGIVCRGPSRPSGCSPSELRRPLEAASARCLALSSILPTYWRAVGVFGYQLEQCRAAVGVLPRTIARGPVRYTPPRGEDRRDACRDLPCVGRGGQLASGGDRAARAGRRRGADRRARHRRELRRLHHGGRALPDAAPLPVQPGHRDGGDRRPVRPRRDALSARRPRDGHAGLRRARRAGRREGGRDLRRARGHDLRGSRRLSHLLYLEPRGPPLAGTPRARRDAARAGIGGRRRPHRRRDRQGDGRARHRRRQHRGEAGGGPRARRR